MPVNSDSLLPQHLCQPTEQPQAPHRRCWRWHLIYWLAYLLLKSFYLSQMLPLQGLSVAPAVLSYTLLTGLCLFWSTLLLWPLLQTARPIRSPIRTSARRLLAGLLPLLLLLLPLRILLLQSGSQHASSYSQWYHYLVSGLPQTLLPLAGWLVMVLLLLQQQQQRHVQQQQQMLQQQLQQARLALLHYQLDPHFMFNCLNALDTLVVSRRAGAAIALAEQLAVFLRQACKAPEHWQGWPDELATVRSYLAISQTRFGERLQVQWDLTTQAPAALPPLLLQPLTELMIEQLVAASNDSYQFSISTTQHDAAGWQLTLQLTSASGQPLPRCAAPAAVSRVQQRLWQRYGETASCQLEQTGTVCLIHLIIPGGANEQTNPLGAG